MRRLTLCIALVLVATFVSSVRIRGDQGHVSHSGPSASEPRAFLLQDPPPRAAHTGFPILVRPSTLAAQIGELAGHSVRVPYSRVVGVFNPRAFLIDTASRLPNAALDRGRILVLIEPGSLRVTAGEVVSSTVTVLGVARTLLGMRVSAEVPWPPEVSPDKIDRLEIRAALLASSVQTADGIEITGRSK